MAIWCCAGDRAEASQGAGTAAEIGVTASAPETAYAGDPVQFEITVTGSRDAAPPEVSAFKGVRATYGGSQDRSSSFTMIVNGQVTRRDDISVAFTYEVTADNPGLVTIPPINVTVAGRAYSTQAVTIRVLEPTAAANDQLRVTLESDAPYIGQPISVTLTWTRERQVKSARMEFEVPEGIEVIAGPDPRPQGAARAVNDGRYAQIQVGTVPVIASLGRTAIGGKVFETVTAGLVVIPSRAGTFALGPARVNYDAVIGQRPPRFMDSPFEDRTVTQKMYASAEPVTMTVRELPLAGRPADFTGLVGSYGIAARANPTSVSVGEPIELEVAVYGPFPLSRVPPLDQRAQLGSDPRLKVGSEPVLPTVGPRSATYQLQVRARTSALTEIPSVELNFFDPASGEYRVAKSAPIPIRVTGTDAAVAFEDDSPSSKAAAPAVGGQAETMDDQLAGIDPTPVGEGSDWARVASELSSKRLTVAAGACLLVGVMSWGWVAISSVRAARSGSRAGRAASAYRRARRAMARGARTTDRPEAVLGAYFAEAAGFEPSSATWNETTDACSPWMTADTRARLREVLSRADARFGPGGGRSDQMSHAQTRAVCRGLLDRVHAELLRAGGAAVQERAGATG